MPRRPRRLPEPREVLAGRARASIEVLFALVHEVNPTDLHLDPEEEALRYAEKSALQSLLIARHGDALSVEEVSEDLVSLRHRHGMADACHAVVSTLDDAARRWVRGRLVEAGLDEPEAIEPVETSSIPAVRPPLARGRAALDEWDYDGARACFEEALRTRPSEEAAFALLDLLVNHLGLDRAALEHPLPARVSSTRVRKLRALAAARLGERDQVRRLLTELPRSDTGEVLVALARQALRTGDLDEAEAHLRALRQVDPANGVLLRIGEELDRRRADLRAPAEARVSIALAAGRLDDAEARAHDLLAAHPGNEVATRALAAVERRRGRITAYRLIARADALESSGDHPGALHALSLAARADPSLDLAARQARLEGVVRTDRERRLVEGVVTRLCAGAGLEDYAALAPVLRARVRERADHRELGWLDALGPASPEQAAAAVRAVLAAEEQVAEGRPGTALAVLEPHSQVLGSLEHARVLIASARERLAEEARARTRTLLDRCEAALIDDDLDAARRSLGDLDEVPDDLRPDRDALAELLAEAELEAEHERRFQACLDAGDHLGARDLAARFGWEARRAEHAARVREQWALQVLPGEVAYADLRDHRLSLGPGEPPTWLGGDGREACAVDARDHWLFVRVVDLEAGAIREVVTLRTPEPLDRAVVQVAGRRLWIRSGGRLLVLAVAPWDIVAWVDLSRRCHDQEVEGAAADPSGEHLWVRLSGRPRPRTVVLDTRTWRPTCELKKARAIVPVYGAHEPWVALLPRRGVVSLYAPHGGRRSRWRQEFGQVDGLAMTAWGHGCSVRAWVHIRDDKLYHGDAEDDISAPRHVLWLPERGLLRAFASDGPEQVATSRATELTYSIATGSDGIRRLGCAAWSEETVEGVYDGWYDGRWQIGIPPRAMLAHHPQAEGVALVVPHGRGVTWYALGEEPPQLDADALPEPGPVPGFTLPAAMLGEPELIRQQAVTLERGLRDDHDAPLDPGPDRALVQLLRAWRRAEAGEWERVVGEAESVSEAELPGSMRTWLHYLLGVARVRTGDLRGGLRALQRSGTSRTAPADLPWQVAFVEELLDLPGHAEREQAMPVAIRIARAAREADAAVGAPRAVIDAVDLPEVHVQPEVQTWARLATAWLELEARGPRDRYRKLSALAGYLDAYSHRLQGDAVDLPLGPASWDDERLEELARAAREWLSV